MLAQRVITAVVLLALLLPALFVASPWPFALLTLILIGAAGWEWGRLNGRSFGAALGLGAVVVALCGLAGAALISNTVEGSQGVLWLAAAAAWLVGGAFALRAGVAGWPAVPLALRLALGVVMLVAAWLALVLLRSGGVNLLLSVLCLVWAADIAAYFGGRAFGRRKLAPTISPGKSWEGVAFGVLGVLALAVLWLFVERRLGLASPSFYSRLAARFGLVGAALLLVPMAGLSVVGDLFESLVKRAAGAKDSSRLLPGHGGVLDRIDALLPVLPAALAALAL